MTISLTNIGTNSGSVANGATLTIMAPAGGVPSGALICVGVCNGGNGSASTPVTDTTGNSYILDASNGLNGHFSNGKLDFLHVYNCLALNAGDLITVTNNGTAVGVSITAFYATGILNIANPYDNTFAASNVGSGPNPTVTAGAIPVLGGSLVVGMIGTGGPSTDTFTQDSSNAAYATPPVRSGSSGLQATVAGGSVVSSAQLTYAPSITTKPWAVSIAAFKPTFIDSAANSIFVLP